MITSCNPKREYRKMLCKSDLVVYLVKKYTYIVSFPVVSKMGNAWNINVKLLMLFFKLLWNAWVGVRALESKYMCAQGRWSITEMLGEVYVLVLRHGILGSSKFHCVCAEIRDRAKYCNTRVNIPRIKLDISCRSSRWTHWRLTCTSSLIFMVQPKV
jgi:hypothetical protein